MQQRRFRSRNPHLAVAHRHIAYEGLDIGSCESPVVRVSEGSGNGPAESLNYLGANALDRQTPLSVEMRDLPVERFHFVLKTFDMRRERRIHRHFAGPDKPVEFRDLPPGLTAFAIE